VVDTWVCDHRMNLKGNARSKIRANLSYVSRITDQSEKYTAVKREDGDLHIADREEDGSIPWRMLCDTG
jgi:hypothetical protein